MTKLFAHIASILFLLPAVLFAQTYENGLSTQSVDPLGDRKELLQAKKHLDSIRIAENRPTVALVLCGGGAKGAAQVGVLKVIEELDIPVDFVCGTSIGGLVGGIYAMGYNADFIGELFKNADWDKLLSDKVPQENVSLNTRKYKSCYQLSFPFHYASENSHRKASNEEISSHETDGKLHIGKNANVELNTQSGIQTLASSLPSGYVYGFNVNNLLSSLTVGYHDSLSFASLPIPFFCVATEMVSCKTKHWGSGELKTAMRSTMSIPGLFTPVRIQGLVLTDGGTRNNFPVDIARAVGADIIIGVDLTDAYATIDNINNVGTILGQFVNMLGRESYEYNKQGLDVYIHPDLEGYDMMSFSAEAVDTMINRGIAAGRLYLKELEAVKKRVGSCGFKLCGKPAVDISKTAVTISSITVKGLSDIECGIIKKHIPFSPGDKVTSAQLENSLSVIEGSGGVESITYSLYGEEEPYELVINCVKSPTDRLGVGLRFDSEVWADLALNYGWNVNRMAGPKLDVHAKLGLSQSLYARFMMDYGVPVLNVDASIANNNVKFKSGSSFENYEMDFSFWTHQERVFFSTDKLHKLDLQTGLRNRYFNVRKSSAGTIFLEDDTRNWGNFVGAFLNLDYNTLDRMYFPTSGLSLGFVADCDFIRTGNDCFSPIGSEYFYIKGVIKVCERFDIIPDFHLRFIQDRYNTSTDSNGNTVSEYSPLHRNYFGGAIKGRYISHQIPFIGMDHIAMCADEDIYGNQISYDDLMVLNLDFRVRIAKSWYVSAMGGYVHMAPDINTFFIYDGSHRDIFGTAVQGSFNSIFGPLSVKFHWCNRTGVFKNDWGVYLAAGFDF